MFTIITEYPAWLIVLCAALAFAYSFLLYRKDKKLADLSRWKKRLLSVFRFLAVFIIAILLLSPLIKTIKETIEKPVLIFAQDNSASVINNKDSAKIINAYPKAVEEFLAAFSDDFEIKTYQFSGSAEPGLDFSFSGKRSDYSNLLNDLINNFSGRNVGALVIAGDGAYNKGKSLVYETGEIKYPIYTIALGDTNIPKDLYIKDVFHNSVTFLGSRFPVQIIVSATKLKGCLSKLVITHQGRKIFQKNLEIDKEDFRETVNVEIEADRKGLQHYYIALTPCNDEINTKNNARDIAVEVIDNKKKILMLANSPHPDLGAVKSALSQNKYYNTEVFTIDDFSKDITGYNLVILHQLPSRTQAATSVLQKIQQHNIPVLYIIGVQTNLQSINNLGTGFRIHHIRNTYDEAQPLLNNEFNIFETGEDLETFIEDIPPLIVPFGNYNLGTAGKVLFYQEVKNIATQKPLLFFIQQAESRTGFIAGEGIWRWKLHNYRLFQNHKTFNALVNKIIQYLALRIDKENLMVYTKKMFNETSPVIFEAELYNEAFELINEPEMKLNIYSEDDKKYAFSFNRTNQAYRLNAGVFPVGDYTYEAITKHGDKTLKKPGKFTILPVNIESFNTIADHRLLYQLSFANQGKMFFPDQLNQLKESIKNNENIAARSYTEKKLQEIVHLKWIFFLILVLISVEWFLRKLYGTY